MDRTMITVSASKSRSRPRFTQRQMYFFVLWLPLLVHVVTIFSALPHVPFALVHSWNARHKTTRDLLRSSWRVPFKLGLLALLECTAIVLWNVVKTHGQFDWRAGLWASLCCGGAFFAAALGMLALGWLLLLTIAKRWPLDHGAGPNQFR